METAPRIGVGATGDAGAGRSGPLLDGEARAAALGDLAAFERVYRATVPGVFALARRLLGTGEAEEATQEVFLRAWRKLASWRGEASFGSWLHRLSLNAILDRRAGLRSNPRAGGAPSNPEPADPEPVARGDRAALRLDLEAAIEALPAGARTVFVLHDVEGHDHREIAELLSVSVGTSKSQLHRARLLLREALGPLEDHHG